MSNKQMQCQQLGGLTMFSSSISAQETLDLSGNSLSNLTANTLLGLGGRMPTTPMLPSQNPRAPVLKKQVGEMLLNEPSL